MEWKAKVKVKGRQKSKNKNKHLYIPTGIITLHVVRKSSGGSLSIPLFYNPRSHPAPGAEERTQEGTNGTAGP